MAFWPWSDTVGAMKHFYILACSGLLLVCGCSTTKPLISPALLQQGVSSAVAFGTAKYPSAVPFVRAAEPVICSASEGTNLAPAVVVAAIQEANVLQTAESVFIVNSALLLYEGVYNAFGADAVNNSAQLKEYLHATCLGIGQGIIAIQPGPLRMPPPPRPPGWPQVGWPR